MDLRLLPALSLRHYLLHQLSFPAALSLNQDEQLQRLRVLAKAEENEYRTVWRVHACDANC